MNRFKNLLSKSPLPILSKNQQAATVQINIQKSAKKYQTYAKNGPQLMITQILMIHGPLQNKQLWRIYSRMLKQNQKKQNNQKINCFTSLTHMKRIIKFMKEKEKLISAGFNKKAKQHLGWKIIQEKALKRVHPEAIEKIQSAINSKDMI